ncbi:MAG TPA: tyrosine-protein phosphatase [Chthonomonadaceae bacterium]|nr:tyrosine-protein phosphatase [Chthonomonadaceae bacterium]
MNSFFASICVAASLCGAGIGQTLTAPAAVAPVASAATPGTPAAAAPAVVTGAAARVWAASARPSTREVEKGLPNFGKLNAAVWRSGAPRAEGYARLAEIGVKTVVNLQKENPSEKDRVPAGVNYVYIPITDEHAPTKEQAQQFLDVVADPANWPVLVHCHAGEGRAGLMCALVRHSFDGWDDKMIMNEVDNFHVTHFALFKGKMNGSQRHFLLDWEAQCKPGSYKEKVGQVVTASATTSH